MMKLTLLLLLAVTVALIICERSARAQTPAAALSLTASAEVRAGDPFTVTVVGTPPPGGFAAFQSALGLGGMPVTSGPVNAWDACAFPAYADLGPPGVLYACVTSPIALSTYSGPLVALSARCDTPGTYAVQLFSGAPSGSYYLDDRGAVILPDVGGLTAVECKSAPCWADLTGDGAVAVGDIGAIVAAFGTASPLDRDYDSLVSVADIFIVVQQFGGTCT